MIVDLSNDANQANCSAGFGRKPVSYEQAKKLKDAGFEERTAGYFINGNLHFSEPRVGPSLVMNFAECVRAPYLDDVLKSGNEVWKTIVSN